MSHLTRRELQDLRNAGNASEMAAEEIEQLRDVLLGNGFVRCDIAACNCGGYHARFGLRERFDEFKQALSDAGHPLTNENGNLPLGALQALVAERDALAARQWQPIETAPKDGTYFLMGNAGGAFVGHYKSHAESGYRFDSPWRCVMLNCWHMSEETRYAGPTHWMPLPPPPEAG